MLGRPTTEFSPRANGADSPASAKAPLGGRVRPLGAAGLPPCMLGRPTTEFSPRANGADSPVSAKAHLVGDEECQLPEVTDSARGVCDAHEREHSEPRIADSGCVCPPQPRSIFLKAQLV